MRASFPSLLRRSARFSLLTFAGLAPLAIDAADGTWNVTNGNWGTSTNWTGSVIADGATFTANLTRDIGATGTITLDTARTIGNLTIGDTNNTNSFILTGAALTFDNGASSSVLTSTAGTLSNTISAPILLNNSLNIVNAATSTSRTLTLSGAISANTTGLKTITNATTTTGGVIISGPISDGTGSIAVVQSNTGTSLTLSGANTFSGGVTLTAGTLNVNNASALGSGLLTISAGALNNSSAGAVVLTTNNAQAWNGNFSFTGTNSLNLGTGAVTMNASRIVTVNASTLTVGGGISGTTFSLTKAGAGTLLLNGANTYTGGTVISGGVLRFGTGAGTVSGSGSVTINAAGALAATGSTGFTTANEWLASGRLASGSSGALALVSNDTTNINLTANGGFNSLFLGAIGNVTYSGTLTAGTNGYRLGGGGGTLTVSSDLAATGANGLTVNGNTTLTGKNRYKGATAVTSGLLKFDGLDNLGINPAISLAAGGVQYNDGNAVDLTIRNVTLGAGSVVDTNGNNVVFANALLGTGTFTKTGVGMLTLETPRAATGATSVSNGALRIGANNTLSTAAGVTLGAGSTAGILNLNGNDQTVTTFNVATNSTTAVNRLQITQDNTFTTTGNVTIGADSAANATTLFTADGGGKWNVINTANTAVFQIGGATGSTNTNTATADFTGLSELNVQLTGTGTAFRVGDNTVNTSLNTSSVKLAPITTIKADQISIGGDSGGNVLQTLVMGAISNTFYTDMLEVGAADGNGSPRANGTLKFETGTGSLTLRAKNETGRAAVNVVNSVSNTGNTIVGIIDLAGHEADLLISDLIIAQRSNQNGGSAATGTFTFDTGKLNATTIKIAQKLATTDNGAITGTLNIGGGEVTVGTLNMALNANNRATTGPALATLNVTRGLVNVTGTLTGARHEQVGNTATGVINISGDAEVNVASILLAQNVSTGATTSTATASLNVSGGSLNIGSGGLVLSSALTAGSSAVGSLNITGGKVTMAGDITDGGGAGTSTSSITLNGGILDMAGNDIGSGSSAIDTLSFQSGTLQNVATINGSGGFTKTGNGVLNLAGTNTWMGATTLSGGTTVFSDNASLGSAGSAIVFNGGALRWATGNTTDVSARTLTFNTGSSARLDTNGNNVIFNNAIGNAGAGGLIKSGLGKLTLRGVNTYTGATTFRRGVLSADFTGSNTGASRISANGLVANGGTFEVLGTDVSGQTTSLDAGGLNVAQGGSKIVATSQGGNVTTLNLGAITRAAAGGTADFTLPAAGSITTSTANASFAGGSQTILGGYATVDGTTWAVSGSGATAGAISGLATYQNTFVAGADIDAPAGASSPVAMTINSLRFNQAGAANVTLGGALTIATGGILVTPATGAVNISGSSITSGNGQDLIVHQNNPSAATTIGSTIIGDIAVTKSGEGNLILTGNNSYTGGLIINGGKVTITQEKALGAVPTATDADNIIINGGTLAVSTAQVITDAKRGVQIGENGGTLRHEGFRLYIQGVIADLPGQSGVLIIEGSGAGDVVLSGLNTYSGGTILTAGSTTLVLSNTALGTGMVTFAGGSIRTGSNVASLANAIDFAANTTIPGTATQSFTLSGNVTLSGGNRALTTFATVDTTFSGSIGEDGISRRFTKNGTGRLILSGVNTFTGGLALGGGILNVNADAALGAVPGTASANNILFSANSTLQTAANTTVVTSAKRGIAVNGGAVATFEANGATANLTLLGVINGVGGVRTTGLGTVVFANNLNTYQGGTNLDGGTLIANGDGAFGAAAGDLTFSSSSTLQALTDLNLGAGRDVILSSNAVTATLAPNGSTITVNGVISGAGNLAIASTSGTVVLANANTFTGATSIGANGAPGSAVLRLTNAGALAGSSGIVIGANGGDDTSSLELAVTGSNTFATPLTATGRNNSVAHVRNVSGQNVLTGAFTGTGAAGHVNFQSDSGELALNFASATNNRTIAFDGAGNGAVNGALFTSGASAGLIKNGAGTWRLNAAQTNMGTTTVNRGTLFANNVSGSATGTGAVTISGGALGGTGTIQGTTLVNGTGVLRPGDPTVTNGIGRLSFLNHIELGGATVSTDRLILQMGTTGTIADFNDAAGIMSAANRTTYLQSMAATYEATNSGNHDRLIITGNLTLGEKGVIRLGRDDSASAYTYSPVAGDVIDLYDWTGVLDLNGFTYGSNERAGGLIGDLDLPTLSLGLLYDMTLFQSNGIIVVVVPEPSRLLLLFAGLLALMFKRGRGRW